MKQILSNTTLAKLWRLLPRKHKKRFILVAAVLFLSALANLGGIGAIMPFMQVLADPEVVKNNETFMRVYQFFGAPELSVFLLITGAGVLGMFVLANLFMTLSIYVRHMFVQSVASWFTSRLMSGYLEQPYEFYLNHNGAELSKNVFSEVGQVTNGVMTPAMEAAAKGTVSALILIALIIVDPFIAFLAFAVLGGGYALIYRLVKNRLTHLGTLRVEANRNRFRIAAEAFGGIKQVKLSGREGDYMHRFTPHVRRFERTKAKTAIISKIPKFILEIFTIGGILAIALVLFAAEGTVAGVLPILSLYAVAGYRLMPAMQTLFQNISKIRSAGPSVDVLYEDMKNLEVEEQEESPSRTPEPAGGKGATTGNAAAAADGDAAVDAADGDAAAAAEDATSNTAPVPFTHQISLRNITFRYPNTDAQVIKQASLDIEKNTTVGFVGPTGCGKTTLIDIILGLLSPQAGEYQVDDLSLLKAAGTGTDNTHPAATATDRTSTNDMSPYHSMRAWQRRIGYVPQDIYLADDTVTRNVAFGVPEKQTDQEAVEKACRIAKIDEFIRTELAEGYDTVVGERGIRLSGGQRQRIGIARALYHNPEVLILDEATSALDGRTEGAIMDAIHTLAHKKTIVMIAHRLTTLRDCDVIYVLEKGEIVDSGSYEELKGRNEAFQIG